MADWRMPTSPNAFYGYWPNQLQPQLMQHTSTRRSAKVTCGVFSRSTVTESASCGSYSRVSAEPGLCYEAGEYSEGLFHSFLLASPLTIIRHTTDHAWVKDCFLKHLLPGSWVFFTLIKYVIGGIVAIYCHNDSVRARIFQHNH